LALPLELHHTALEEQDRVAGHGAEYFHVLEGCIHSLMLLIFLMERVERDSLCFGAEGDSF